MFLEITIAGKKTIVKDLEKFPREQEFYLGSDTSCDITVTDNSISRKHLSFLKKGEKVFFKDLRSLNGTYIGDDRLAPDTLTELSTFFPLRLGSNVLVTMSYEIPEEERLETSFSSKSIDGYPESEQTRIISVKDLYKAKTQTLVKKKEKTIQQKKSKASKGLPLKSYIIPGLILLFGVGLTFRHRILILINGEEQIQESTTVGQQGPSIPAEDISRVPVPVFSKEEVIAKLNTLDTDAPCDENYLMSLCAGVKTTFGDTAKILTPQDDFIILVEGDPFYKVASDTLEEWKKNAESNQQCGAGCVISTQDQWRLSLAMAALRFGSLKIDPDKFSLKNFFFVLGHFAPGEKFKPNAVMSFHGDAFSRLTALVDHQKILFVRSHGIKSLEFTKELYKDYVLSEEDLIAQPMPQSAPSEKAPEAQL